MFKMKGMFTYIRVTSLFLMGIIASSAFIVEIPLQQRIINVGFASMLIIWVEFMLRTMTKLKEKTKLSFTDELTGLYNDRYFYKSLDKQVKDGREKFSVFKVAIDNLNQYNEKYGYLMGDALIKKTARFLKKYVRSQDGVKVYRYGGGQFLLMTPLADNQDVNHFIGVLQRNLASLTPPPGIAETEKIEVIISSASYPHDGCNSREIIHAVNQSFEDVKEAKYRELEEFRRRSEKLAVVGQLAAGLAHEIRNPLTTVKGFCSLIKEHSKEENTLEYINILQPELERVCELVKEFLFLTKPAAPKLKPINVNDLIKGCVHLMESEALLKDVILNHELEDNLPGIQGDPEQLKQVLINLIINSIDAIHGKGYITVRAYETPEKKIAIEIEDTGKGIPNEKIVKVFEPFYTTKEEGTGLGLSIANQIVHSHRGKMTIRSIEGKGTTVAIELPKVA